MYELVFQFSNILALAGWLLLLIVPDWKWTRPVVSGVVITLLSGIYVGIFFISFELSDIQRLTTLKGLEGLVNSYSALIVGWVHYLAFDLLVGLYIVNNAAKHGISRYIIFPCLILTFLAGPTGLLLYFIIRTIRTRRYFEKA